MPIRTYDATDDPLTRALDAEIENETEVEQQVRLKKEKEARRVSDSIDESIREEKAALKRTRPVKILLLGTHKACQRNSSGADAMILGRPIRIR